MSARHRLVIAKPTVYHQLQDQQPTLADIPAVQRQLTTDEQPWHRDLKVGQGWIPLAKGCWVDRASLVVVANREGRFTQVVPTPEERQTAEAKVVELVLAKPLDHPPDSFSCEAVDFVAHPSALVSPGCLTMLEPSDLGQVHVRCLNGPAKVTVYVYPA